MAILRALLRWFLIACNAALVVNNVVKFDNVLY